MGRSESFGKKDVRSKQLQKRKDKEKRREEKKERGKSKSFDDMLAWVDENGRICSEPTSSEKKPEVKAENIEVSIPKGGIIKKEAVIKGKIINYDVTKGFGFINSMQLNDSVFFHINECSWDVKTGDKVEFEKEKGQKGLKAFNIKKLI